MEELFRDYWWLIFPLFGMVWALWDMVASDRRQRAAIETLRIYAQQGKDPPPDLIRAALAGDDGFGIRAEFGIGAEGGEKPPARRTDGRAWTFVVFAALAAGFGAGWWWEREESFAFAFLIVAVTMSVLALGALAILVFGRKS